MMTTKRHSLPDGSRKTVKREDARLPSRELKEKGDAILRSRLGIQMPDDFLDDVKVATTTLDAYCEPSEAATNGVSLATNELWEAVRTITGVSLKRRALEAKLRDLVAHSNSRKRAERMAEVLDNLGRPKGVLTVREGEQLLREKLLSPPSDYDALDSKPLAKPEVCRECYEKRPDSIWFRRLRPDETGVPPHRWVERENTLRGLLAARLGDLGVLAFAKSVDTELVRHRGQCQGHGHDQIGRGFYDYPGILARIDFGDGLVIEREFEVE